LGMDIYLFEILPPDAEGEDIRDFGFYSEFPEWVEEYAFEKPVEYIDNRKIAEDYGKSLKDLIGLGFSEDKYILQFRDDRIELTDEELDKKYIVIRPRKSVKVRQLAYARYGYLHGHFKIHPFGNTEEVMKHGLKSFYFDPEEMSSVKQIFKASSVGRWSDVQKEFRKALQEGKKCFVWVSW